MIVPADACPAINAPKVFLEVGCHYGSVPAYGEYEFGDDEQYVGINVSLEALERAEAEISLAAIPFGREPILIHGDGQALPAPIEDDSVDTVYFGNVFGDPGIDAFHIAELRTQRVADWLERSDHFSERFEPNAMQEPITPRDLVTLPGLLREAHRVIKPKPTGKLVVLETLSPFMDEHMATFMDDAGFGIDAHVHHTEEAIDEWQRLVRPFKRYEAGLPPAMRTDYSLAPNYIVFASKLAIAKAA